MIECEPELSDAIVNAACPPESVTIPRVAAPSVNVTDPVGVPLEPLTPAVKVTDCPIVLGFTDDERVVVVEVGVTLWINADDVLLLKFVSPPYAAVIECDAALKDEVVKVACPLASVVLPRVVPPSLNVTVPVGVPPEPTTVAVKVTDCPAVLGFAEEDTVVVVAIAVTVIDAEAVPPGVLSLENTGPVVLFFTPTLVAVTLTEKLQPLFSASVAPDRLMTPVPAAAAMVPPPHEPVRPFGVDTTIPEGNVSVKPTPVRVPPGGPLGLPIWNARDAVPPTAIEGMPNDLVIVGEELGGASTVRNAVALPPAPAFVWMGLVKLTFPPAAVPVTLTENVHEAPCASVAPERMMLLVPAVAVMVPPPHEPLRPFGVDTTSPDGSESVKPTPLAPAGPVTPPIVKDSEVLPPTGMVASANDLEKMGGVCAKAGLISPPSERVARASAATRHLAATWQSSPNKTACHQERDRPRTPDNSARREPPTSQPTQSPNAPSPPNSAERLSEGHAERLG